VERGYETEQTFSEYPDFLGFPLSAIHLTNCASSANTNKCCLVKKSYPSLSFHSLVENCFLMSAVLKPPCALPCLKCELREVGNFAKGK